MRRIASLHKLGKQSQRFNRSYNQPGLADRSAHTAERFSPRPMIRQDGSSAEAGLTPSYQFRPLLVRQQKFDVRGPVIAEASKKTRMSSMWALHLDEIVSLPQARQYCWRPRKGYELTERPQMQSLNDRTDHRKRCVDVKLRELSFFQCRLKRMRRLP